MRNISALLLIGTIVLFAFHDPSDIQPEVLPLALSKTPRLTYPEPTERPAADPQPYRLSENHGRTPEVGQSRVRGRPMDNAGFPITVPEGATPSMVSLRIDGPVSDLTIHDPRATKPGDISALAAHITKDARTDQEKAEAIFNFVLANFDDWWFPAEGRRKITTFPKNVARQLWGYGYGFCTDKGQITTALWQAAGLRAAVTELLGVHTVCSVYFDDGWRLYDPQHQTRYLKPDGKPASAEELEADPSLFNQDLDRFGYDPIGYPPSLAAGWHGKTKKRHTEKPRWETDYDFSLDLRAGERYSIHYVGRPWIYRPHMWFQQLKEFSYHKEPPTPVRGLLTYRPGENPMDVQTISLNDGRAAYVVPMRAPYLFTNGWITVPGQEQATEAYLYVHGELLFVGPMIGGTVPLEAIAGTHEFAVVVVPPKPFEDAQAAMKGLELRAYTQMAPLGLPQLEAGPNTWPVTWNQGRPTLTTWFRDHGPDLEVTGVSSNKQHPKNGEPVRLTYTVTNKGSGSSEAVEMRVVNATTALYAETTLPVGTTQIPPLEPGESAEVSLYWRAGTRMTWYGQNPLIQRFIVHIDPHKTRSDHNRANHTFHHYIHMADGEGNPAQLPGYSEIGVK